MGVGTIEIPRYPLLDPDDEIADARKQNAADHEIQQNERQFLLRQPALRLPGPRVGDLPGHGAELRRQIFRQSRPVSRIQRRRAQPDEPLALPLVQNSVDLGNKPLRPADHLGGNPVGSVRLRQPGFEIRPPKRGRSGFVALVRFHRSERLDLRAELIDAGTDAPLLADRRCAPFLKLRPEHQQCRVGRRGGVDNGLGPRRKPVPLGSVDLQPFLGARLRQGRDRQEAQRAGQQ